jgi:hypothetical protein
MLKQKRQARATWHRYHHPASKTLYNQLTNRLKSTLKAVREASFTEYVLNLNRYDYSIWKPIQNSRKPQEPLPPLRNTTPDAHPWARSNHEKAELFAHHFAQIFTPHSDDRDQEIEQVFENNATAAQLIQPTTPTEIKKILNSLKLKSAPGPDLLTPTMIRELPKKAIVLLTYIFNGIVRMPYWPKPFKTSHIITVLKPGKEPTNVNSYRPISLTSVLSKLFEKLILKRLQSALQPDAGIPDHQFGFRRGHSTIQQVHRIVHSINKAMEGKQYCSAVFLDVSQAFDRVWHKGLIYKIHQLLPPIYPKFFKSYLQDRQFQIKVGSANSQLRPIQAGVPQGSVLGPLLYTLYTHDLPVSTHTTTGSFADDIAILSSHVDPTVSTTNLQAHLHSIQTWITQWRIKINETKSSHMTFTLQHRQSPDVYLNNILIPRKLETKYLGMTLDSRLSWKPHIVKKRKQIDLTIQRIHWLIGRASKLSIANKLLIYKTIIIPIWTYGLELWGCASKSNLAIIQRAQSKIIRMIANAPWYVSNDTLHKDFGLPYVHDTIRQRSIRHHNKLQRHNNPLLKPLLTPEGRRRLKRKWPADLTRS